MTINNDTSEATVLIFPTCALRSESTAGSVMWQQAKAGQYENTMQW